MHHRPIRHVHSGRQSPLDRDPADCSSLAVRPTGGPPEFRSQATLDQNSKRLPEFCGTLLGGNEEIIGEIHGCFHMGKQFPVFIASQMAALVQESPRSCFSRSSTGSPTPPWGTRNRPADCPKPEQAAVARLLANNDPFASLIKREGIVVSR